MVGDYQKLALTSFELLARQSQQTEGILQIKILQIVFDLLVLHGIDFGAEANFSVSPPFPFLDYRTDAT
jgi:condensin complex subunit 3